MTDEEIIAALKGTDRAKRNRAMQELLSPTYRNIIRNFILKNNGSESDVSDMHHIAIMELFDQIQREKYERSASIKTYIYAIVRNQWLKMLRKNKRIVIVDTEDMPVLADWGEKVVEEKEEQMKHILDSLIKDFANKPKKNAHNDIDCITLLRLRFYDNMSDEEIASRYAINSHVTVRTKRFRCLENLRKVALQRGLDSMLSITATHEP
ncbi:MAG: sigma-70 family RNA polymerase sigma factor [Cytophagales bacterium]|nr:sigma-70 family RNA polymerase sigma factor [Bernardetiaceae bacterium]MDW8205166.1 sigma-70 family RNA polymerase sigma factor [Cytophagales bacterium]